MAVTVGPMVGDGWAEFMVAVIGLPRQSVTVCSLLRHCRQHLQCLIMRLIVRSSAIHAAGVFTLERIPKGTLVVEYTGTRMKHDDADTLYDARPYTYLFGVGDGSYVVDGYGMAMYLVHSCSPH